MQAIENKDKESSAFEFKRSLNMLAYGTMVIGPFSCLWYTKWLPTISSMGEKIVKDSVFK
jgi:hypothetical protein